MMLHSNSAAVSTDIDVGICTFRRPHLAETLRSVARLALEPGWRLRVIVADNDDAPTARVLVEAAARETGLHLTYVHAPARNISVARNACLDAAAASVIAFIDDDELVAGNWLIALMSTMKQSGADAVFGPVHAVYRPECPAWISKADYHSTLPSRAGGKIVAGATGNVLIRRAAIPALRFREELGRSGGEDTAFFHALSQAGGRFAFSPDALATEIVPKERESLSWLLKRRFRYGETHGLLLLETCGRSVLGHARHALIAAGKAGFCFTMALLNTPRASHRRFWSLRGALHSGVACRLLGKRKAKQYG
jgi:succinoglycan biosynthesis protein ExoM